MKCLKIGEEAIVPVQTWSEDAPGYKQLRSALRRVERSGGGIAGAGVLGGGYGGGVLGGGYIPAPAGPCVGAR